MGFRIFDPTVEPQGEGFSWAPRPEDLHGRVVALLDNGKPNADRLLEHVGALLARERAVGRVTRVRKLSAYRPAPDELLAAVAKEADLVVVGIGD